MKMMRYFDKGVVLFRLVLLSQLTFFATIGATAPLRLEITEGVVEPLAFAAPTPLGGLATSVQFGFSNDSRFQIF